MHWSPIHIAKRDEMVMKEMVIAENGSIEAKAKGMITIAPIMINTARIKEKVYSRIREAPPISTAFTAINEDTKDWNASRRNEVMKLRHRSKREPLLLLNMHRSK